MKTLQKNRLIISCSKLEPFYKHLNEKKSLTKQYFLILSDGSQNRWQLTLFNDRKPSKCPIISLSTQNTKIMVEFIEQNNQRIKTLSEAILQVSKKLLFAQCIIKFPDGPSFQVNAIRDKRSINDSYLNEFTHSFQQSMNESRSNESFVESSISLKQNQQRQNKKMSQKISSLKDNQSYNNNINKFLPINNQKQLKQQMQKQNNNIKKQNIFDKNKQIQNSFDKKQTQIHQQSFAQHKNQNQMDRQKRQSESQINQNEQQIVQNEVQSRLYKNNGQIKSNEIVIDEVDQYCNSSVELSTLREQYDYKKHLIKRNQVNRGSNNHIQQMIIKELFSVERISAFKNPLNQNVNENKNKSIKISWKLKARSNRQNKFEQEHEKKLKLCNETTQQKCCPQLLKQINPQKQEKVNEDGTNKQLLQLKRIQYGVNTEFIQGIKTEEVNEILQKRIPNLRLQLNKILATYRPAENDNIYPISLKHSKSIRRYQTQQSARKEFFQQQNAIRNPTDFNLNDNQFRYNISFICFSAFLSSNVDKLQTLIKLTINETSFKTSLLSGRSPIWNNCKMQFKNIYQSDFLVLSLHQKNQKKVFGKVAIPMVRILNSNQIETCVLNKKVIAAVVKINYQIRKINFLPAIKLLKHRNKTIMKYDKKINETKLKAYVETNRKSRGSILSKESFVPRMRKYIGGANVKIGKAPRFSYVEQPIMPGPGRYQIQSPFVRHSLKQQ